MRIQNVHGTYWSEENGWTVKEAATDYAEGENPTFLNWIGLGEQEKELQWFEDRYYFEGNDEPFADLVR